MNLSNINFNSSTLTIFASGFLSATSATKTGSSAPSTALILSSTPPPSNRLLSPNTILSKSLKPMFSAAKTSSKRLSMPASKSPSYQLRQSRPPHQSLRRHQNDRRAFIHPRQCLRRQTKNFLLCLPLRQCSRLPRQRRPVISQTKKSGTLTITHKDMTRFWITLPQAAEFVWTALQEMRGGEIFVPKLPSIKITDLAKAIAPNAKIKIAGIRPGEKLHEELIMEEESERCKEFKDYYQLIPLTPHWTEKQLNYRKYMKDLKHKKFSYKSDTNKQWLTPELIKKK